MIFFFMLPSRVVFLMFYNFRNESGNVNWAEMCAERAAPTLNCLAVPERRYTGFSLLKRNMELPLRKVLTIGQDKTVVPAAN
jgi:hypothetical protein